MKETLKQHGMIIIILQIAIRAAFFRNGLLLLHETFDLAEAFRRFRLVSPES